MREAISRLSLKSTAPPHVQSLAANSETFLVTIRLRGGHKAPDRRKRYIASFLPAGRSQSRDLCKMISEVAPLVAAGRNLKPVGDLKEKEFVLAYPALRS